MTDNTSFLTIILYVMLAIMFALAVALIFIYLNMKVKEKQKEKEDSAGQRRVNPTDSRNGSCQC